MVLVHNHTNLQRHLVPFYNIYNPCTVQQEWHIIPSVLMRFHNNDTIFFLCSNCQMGFHKQHIYELQLSAFCTSIHLCATVGTIIWRYPHGQLRKISTTTRKHTIHFSIFNSLNYSPMRLSIVWTILYVILEIIIECFSVTNPCRAGWFVYAAFTSFHFLSPSILDPHSSQ